MGLEITAEMVEEVFGKHSDSSRFANFCNSIVIAESSASSPSIQIVSEKPGADGGLDGEWTIPAHVANDFKSPFGLPGWNVFQYKARGITGEGRKSALSKLCTGIKGSLVELKNRLVEPKECRQYSLFTNLQLGLDTLTKTRDEKILQKQRKQLCNAISQGSDGKTFIQIFDAAQLAAIVNAHPALRLTYFSGTAARSWNDAWNAEHRIKDYKVAVPLVGRSQELNCVTEWLKDSTTKVVVLCGSSGMGKTRLALEATRQFASTVTVVEVVDELLRTDFQALGTSISTRFIVVEDPTREQAEALAKRAVACEGVKLILTVPTDSKAPAPKLTPHEGIQIMPPLKPLNNKDAEDLLKAAGGAFDRQALDWILLQAGGNPEILLSAAELKSELRDKSGDLKKSLYQRFRTKIEKELGADGIRALKALSPILHVKHQGENSELRLICDCLDLGVQSARILELLPDLERMGYIRRRGNFVSVIPPLFAARLVEELAATHDDSIPRLFSSLSKSARGRFLERMVTVDLPERSIFWDYIFSENGPLQNGPNMDVHFDHIESLARAVPGRTARLLESKLNDQAGEAWRGHYCVSTLRELAYQAESCALGMRCLELLALKEIERTTQIKETQLFCECFVDWYHDFPMSYQERRAWIEGLLKSEDRTRRLLGVHVVAFVTEPPSSLSGYSGGVARRLGQPPPRRLWQEVFDYMERLVQLRFELTQSNDNDIAEIALKDFGASISQLVGHLSPDQFLLTLERLVEWTFIGKLPLDVTQIRTSIHWVEERYTESSQKPDQKLFHDKWVAVLRRIANLRERFDGGNFLVRLKIGIGSDFEFEWEEGQEGHLYGYQKRIRALATEVVNNPALMAPDAWEALKHSSAVHSGEFIQGIGECDHQKQFLGKFESDTKDHPGVWRFSLYCLGLYRSDPSYVDQYLNELATKSIMPKASLLWPIRFIGPTSVNRRLLLQFIAEESVDAADVANMFTTGRWLDDLPISEVVTIMTFITKAEKWTQWAASVLSLYLHANKALPKDLLSIGERMLKEMEETYENAHKCNRIAIGIAKTDLEKGFNLLEDQVVVLNGLDWRKWRAVWNPFRRHGGNEFWVYLRSKNPERAYRCFCGLTNRHLRNEISVDSEGSLLDLEKHASTLLKIANDSEENAEQIANSVTIKQPHFFPFAFEFLSGRPTDGKIASLLSSTVIQRFGFGTPMEKEQSALRDVETQLKSPNVPDHGRGWLEGLKTRIQETIKNSPWNTGDNEPHGWA